MDFYPAPIASCKSAFTNELVLIYLKSKRASRRYQYAVRWGTKKGAVLAFKIDSKEKRLIPITFGLKFTSFWRCKVR